MGRWSGRVAMVTGASAGIGAAIARELVLKGMKVVGLARRVDRVEAMKQGLKSAPGQLFCLKGDVTQEKEVLNAFHWIEENLGGVDVLVNNAGVCRFGSHLVSGPTQSWRDIIDTNVLGLSICTREAVKSMRARGVDDGHIIHINSIAGHRVHSHANIGMYSASKHAVTALTDALRFELNDLKSRIRVTSVSPGLVHTDLFNAGSYAEWSDEVVEAMPHLEAEDVAAAVVYALGAPAHVQIHEVTIKPVGEHI